MNKYLSTIALTSLLMLSSGSFANNKDKELVVNVNTATVQELDDKLIGVGKRTAEEIVKHRKEHGPFKNMDDLDQVKFIGEAFMKKNESRIVFEQ
ncbi:ComEA family DNA-binding protein [Endozoicomonas arenosclerae]|uniref:ComEA family DNA-binding protein n=1 Tax=Endozoicomonas arenosclerae TaxID=1633495 RepID=UPI000AE4F7AC|nr:helix-hairpin-helix domain-containing protein [Endozoicomonas arenosclerae]